MGSLTVFVFMVYYDGGGFGDGYNGVDVGEVFDPIILVH